MEYTAPVKTMISGMTDEVPKGITPSIDGLTFEELWNSILLNIVPYWIFMWGFWPVLVFPILVSKPSFVIDIKIGSDILSEKYVLSYVTPGVDPSEYTGTDSFVDNHIDALITWIVIGGIILLFPLLVTSEGLVKSGVGNLTPAQWGLIIATILIASGITALAMAYIEYRVTQGLDDHGDAAFRYECLLGAILFAVVGWSGLEIAGINISEKVTNYLNNQIKDAFGTKTVNYIKNGTKSRFLTVMLITYITMGALFAYCFAYHLYLHYFS